MAGLPLPAAAQSPARGVTTGTLAEACALEARDVSTATGVGYCRGFMTGAGQYHREIAVDRPSIFCLPTPSPSFEAAQASFVAWARANPQYAEELALDGLMRWAAATYPCPTEPAAPAARRNRR
ncbi:Rap1a/Tai family immunity protein [Roseicella aquatilis]|uniref:Rap1a immunity protein domain-containing protein n=1 Tax=Roseicella aquatilis TaxID=2527868 RepID=A0A4R4DSQ3_9PROT|nr:Rap1a/Tai family immunity protein [Roseicella aquatilis]TCZ64816.1 hypothetical protein EXY23_05405 [Roseicella aquatilis]